MDFLELAREILESATVSTSDVENSKPGTSKIASELEPISWMCGSTNWLEDRRLMRVELVIETPRRGDPFLRAKGHVDTASW